MADDAHGFLRGRRVVVFGAGYLGGEVARRAQEAGAAVTAVTRNAEQAARLRDAGLAAVIADLADQPSWDATVPAGPDFVLNAVSAGGGGLEGYRQSYVEGTRAIVDWGRRQPRPGLLVYTSSTSVYPQSGGVRVEESALVGGSDARAELLVEAERQAAQWPGRAAILRLAGLYGPGRHHLLDALRAGETTVGGRADQRLNLIHRDDALAAIFACWAAPAGPSAGTEVFNVADDAPVPKGEVVAWLAERLGRAVPEFTGEPTPGRRAWLPDRIIANDRLKRHRGWRCRYPSFRDGYAGILADDTRGR